MGEEVCVRVAVRVRPLLPKEVLHNHQVCVRIVPDSAQVMVGADRTFPFDHTFGPTSSQAEVYESCVQPLLVSLIEGYNATVFAYGQTGSGKTYTLGGGHIAALPEEEAGIVSLVAQDLFVFLGEKSEVDASVRVSYIELYREELRDLLDLHTIHKEMHIREDDRGNTVVVGAREMAVTSAEELLSLLEAGNALRHTGSTQMNERSSRSHAILTLQLIQHGRDHARSSAHCSKLHLVDLAGSERAGRTGNTGQRLKESVYINTGLLALGNVIRALSSSGPGRRSSHVPYRDAKITRLLRDSLGGCAHTLMVACVSPSHHCVAETLSVLQFASRARSVRNQPGGGLGPRGGGPGWDPGEARVGELEHEVQTLRDALRDRGRAEGPKHTAQEEAEPNRKAREEEESQFRWLAQEAAFLFEELMSPALSGAERQRLEEWLERHRELSLSGWPHGEPCPGETGEARGEAHHVTILQLRRELRRCQEALAIDEAVFEQKEGELRTVRREVESLLQERESQLQTLQEEREHRRRQSEQLVEQQLLIDRLRGDLLTSRTMSSGSSLAAGASGSLAPKRPHSVPLLSQGHSGTRKIHTSPPAYSLERVMAAFKTRSQLLLAQIEERDEVLRTHPIPEEEREEEKEEEEEEEGEGVGGKIFRHSMNRTWTSKQNTSPMSPGTDQNHKIRPKLPQLSGVPAGAEESCIRRSQRLREAGLRASHTQRRIQELSINIRLKEELIKELDKTGKEAQAVDRLYTVDQGKTEATNDQLLKDTVQLRGKRRQADRQGPGCGGRGGGRGRGRAGGQGVVASLCLQSERSRAELQRSVEHLRLQMERLQQGSAPQTDHAQDPPGGKELRTEDLTVCQNGVTNDIKEKHLQERRVWLEQEEELALQRRRGLQELEEELRRREEVLLHREACLHERSQLEIKRLRSSQALSQDLLRVSARLVVVEEELEGGGPGPGSVSLEGLQKERDILRQRRDTLDSQLRDGRLLTAQEEHALLQLEEAMEALDAAVEFKNHTIQERQRQLGDLAHTDLADPAHSDVIRKLRELPLPEALALLVKYFNKVVCLREGERRLQLRCEELHLHGEEQEGVLREMEAALQRLTLDTDRRLTQQHREHQHSIQLLLQQLQEAGRSGPGEADQGVQARLQQLEKDLFFYKSTSRELKRKLRELVNDSLHPHLSSPSSRPSTQGKKGEGGRGDGREVGQLELTPVRLSRKDLRQIFPPDLSISTSRGHSTFTTSRDSFQEDSIEVPRNTD